MIYFTRPQLDAINAAYTPATTFTERALKSLTVPSHHNKKNNKKHFVRVVPPALKNVLLVFHHFFIST